MVDLDFDETTVLLVTFVVLLVPFPLISYGTTEGVESLWWLGIALLIVGGIIPPISRYAFGDEEDDAEDETDGADREGGGKDENGEPGDEERHV